tara:strand:+ start:1944 stop:2159 length:216 start_codon:yes stop_codon:yes gene_type:complete
MKGTTVEISLEQVNKITVDRLVRYYMDIHKESYDAQQWDTLISIDTLLNHFMTPNQYEDFTNGLREDAFIV